MRKLTITRVQQAEVPKSLVRHVQRNTRNGLYRCDCGRIFDVEQEPVEAHLLFSWVHHPEQQPPKEC